MFSINEFYNCVKQNGADVLFFPIPSAGATFRDGRHYAIVFNHNMIASTRFFRGVAMHECGHLLCGALHKTSSRFDLVAKAEHKAVRAYAETYLTVQDFETAFDNGNTELWQLADYFDLPEDDIKKALLYWTQNRGVCFGGYVLDDVI